MNVWSWVWGAQSDLVDNGHDELKNYMDKISSDTCAGRHDLVDSYADEAIAMAKQLNLSWVELFLRHWKLQSHVLHRAKPEAMLKEAVHLLEFSSRDENKDCPQSVCAVQDLANCYGCIDGPGYYEERIAVAQETLDRINPNWDCYGCISAEYVYALLDDHRFEKCIEYVDAYDKTMQTAGYSKDTGYLLLYKTEALARTGKFDLARKLIKKANNSGAGQTFVMNKKVYAALIESKSSNFDKAMTVLPVFKETEKSPKIKRLWAEVLCDCILGDKQYFTPSNMDVLEEIVCDMEARGVYRNAFDLFYMLAELYKRYEQNENQRIVDSMQRIQKKLKKDKGASAKLVKVQSM